MTASYMKDTVNTALPMGNPGEQAALNIHADMIPAFTARFGVAMDHWLFYVKGGGAWVSDKYSMIGTFQGTPFDFEGLALRAGWTVGGGIEYAWTPNWSVKGEYLHFDFSKITADGVFGVNTWGFDHDLFVNSVKVGLNYHFNAPYIPLK